jgi:hypothetical protein
MGINCPYCGCEVPVPDKRKAGLSLGDLLAEIPEGWPDKRKQIAQTWAEEKVGRPAADRYKSITGWRKTLTRMEKFPVKQLDEMVERAIANGWKGWEHVLRGEKGSLPAGIAAGAPRIAHKPLEKPEDPVPPEEARALLEGLKRRIV